MNGRTLSAVLLVAAALGLSGCLGSQATRAGAGTELLPVYGTDGEALNEEVDYYVAVPSSALLEQKLRILAARLSAHSFSHLPVDVLRVEHRGARRIAVIALGEDEHTPWPGRSWRAGYFQGSAGGWSTWVKLVKTFLQPDYEEEWVDAVEFWYEGKPMRDEWDHIDLSGNITRGWLRSLSLRRGTAQ